MIVLEIIHLTLLSTAKAVFTSAYFLVIVFVFYMLRKSQVINLYGYKERFHSANQLIESVLQGIVIGVMGSVVMVIVGLPIKLSAAVLLLLPIAIILSLIHPRFLCFSYALGILACFSFILNGQNYFGINMPNLEIDISGLMALVGVLHLMEAILIYFVGDKNPIPIITKKNNKVIMGYILQRFWPIPFSILALNIGTIDGNVIDMPSWWPIIKPALDMNTMYFFALLPIISALGYRTITFSYEPKEKARASSMKLSLYSIVLILFAMFSVHNPIIKIIGVMYMVIAHEGIMQWDQLVEHIKKPIYTLPKQGVRVISIQSNGIADKLGMEVGDVIHRINGIDVKDTKDYKEVIEENYNFFTIDVEKKDGKKVQLDYQMLNTSKNLGLNYLPENPKIIYQYETLNEFNLLHIIFKKLKKEVK
ncbi:hypothetical protein EDC19_1666 [Natranaerovirga hydrolytica]|uniref:PDZ domain-containing protein n=1 Tax=Natranaerovirga hydrolytica TaxID=680378 RepID=A0A4R1MU14_9FIRM|nr:PDZ domain-containing protein [Natranaerovirga hydrolytica]TCK93473.1 hypothetical protein EDC19_1666 [Natranaerovirga hydrolytica]